MLHDVVEGEQNLSRQNMPFWHKDYFRQIFFFFFMQADYF